MGEVGGRRMQREKEERGKRGAVSEGRGVTVKCA